jgi:hypothetical protein
MFKFWFHRAIDGNQPDDLRDKALLALEKALQDLRYEKARRSFAARFALASPGISAGPVRPFRATGRACD